MAKFTHYHARARLVSAEAGFETIPCPALAQKQNYGFRHHGPGLLSEGETGCGYGATGELTLSRQLQGNHKACTVTAYKDQGGNVAKVEAQCAK